MKHSLSAVCFILILSTGCGGSENQATVTSIPEGNDTITESADSSFLISDTLSADLLSDYGVFAVDDISCSRTGYTALLDGVNATVTVIDQQGAAISTGGSGSGPGEYQWPRAVSVSDNGSVAVSDFLGGFVRILQPDLDSFIDINGFIMANPGEITLLDSGAFVGMRVTFRAEDGESFIGHQTALWAGTDSEPTVVYSESMRPFSLNDFGWSIVVPYPMACSPDGIVYTADVSSERYVLTSYSPDGTVMWSVGRPFQRTEKTEEEIELEREMVTRRMQQSEHQADYTPDPYNYAVSSLSLGPDGNLWAERPGAETVFFDVFHPSSGDFLYSVSSEADYELLKVTPAGLLAVPPGESQLLLRLDLKPADLL